MLAADVAGGDGADLHCSYWDEILQLGKKADLINWTASDRKDAPNKMVSEWI